MYTYQDLLQVADTDDARMDFVKRCINQHKSSNLYKTAAIATEYDKRQNKTITDYQKLLYDMTGKAIPDNYSANFKMASGFFNLFITQENQYLLGNGVTWTEESTKEKLGKNFDTDLQKLGHKALVGGVAFGFWNYDHLDTFSVLEFAPIYDEENGALMAGVRFWQVSPEKPLRATFYEIDGYTDYIYNTKEDSSKVLHEKQKYILKIRTSEADGLEIYDGENYPSFPIVPLWANEQRQSEIVGLREQIDCYDLIKSGYANTVDDGSLIYWTLQNAGGMGDEDLASFIQKMKTLHATTLDDGVSAESHQLEAPYQSREALLATLRSDLFENAKALDTKNIANGAITATQIKASYENLNLKTNQFEFCVIDFINDILNLAGIEDNPTFTRSVIVNNQEELQLVIQSAQFLDQEYITRKVLTLLGDGDQAEEILQRMIEQEQQMAEEQQAMMELTAEA